MTDYAELRAASEVATPGPWKWITETCERGPVWKGKPIRVSLSAPRNSHVHARTAVLAPNWNTSEGDVWQAWISCNEANANYIAAANPSVIRALLAERDALREALKQYASPENWEQDEHGWSRLWLEPDSTSRRSYDGRELAHAALAQNQGD